MRRIALVLICILFLVTLFSCDTVKDDSYSNERFLCIYKDGFSVYVDTETGVQYLCDYMTGGGVEWIVLVDTEGKPLIYKGAERYD